MARPNGGLDLTLFPKTIPSADSAAIVAPPPAVPGFNSQPWLPLVLPVSAGVLIGLLTALVLSTSKPHIGMLGIVLFGVLVAVGLLMVFAARGGMSLYLASRRESPPGLRQQIAAGLTMMLLFMASYFAACAILVALEAVSPAEGVVRYIANRGARRRLAAEEKVARAARGESQRQWVEEQRALHEERAAAQLLRTQQQQAAEKLLAAEQTAWRTADFLLVNPTHRALAVRWSGTADQPQYLVMAKSDETAIKDRLKTAWAEGIPVVGDDPAFTRRLFDRYEHGQQLNADEARSLHHLSKLRPLVPNHTKYVSFVDQQTKTQRIGHFAKGSEDEFVFCNLLPKRSLVSSLDETTEANFSIETVPLAGLKVTELSDHQLRLQADFLEYAVHTMLAQLQAHLAQNTTYALRPCIFVDSVTIEENVQDQVLQKLEANLAAAKYGKREAIRGNPDGASYGYESSAGLPAIVRALAITVRERERDLANRSVRDSLRQDYEREIVALKAEIEEINLLLDTSRQITRDLRRLLVQSGMTVVERSEKAKAAYNRVNGNKWLRPEADAAIQDGLINATHLLIAEIDRAVDAGECQLAMRLIDVRTGAILWADNGDREMKRLTNAANSPTSLSGVWVSQDQRTRLQLIENKGQLTASLVSDNDLVAFTLSGSRIGDSVYVDHCSVVLTNDPARQSVAVSADVKLVSANRIDIYAPRVNLYRTSRGVIQRNVANTSTPVVFSRLPQ